MSDKLTLRSVIETLSSENKIPIGYASFRQAYTRGTIPQEIAQYISEVKKFTSISYYVEKSDLEEFTEALIKQFN